VLSPAGLKAKTKKKRTCTNNKQTHSYLVTSKMRLGFCILCDGMDLVNDGVVERLEVCWIRCPCSVWRGIWDGWYEWYPNIPTRYQSICEYLVMVMICYRVEFIKTPDSPAVSLMYNPRYAYSSLILAARDSSKFNIVRQPNTTCSAIILQLCQS
jgi:hypothetical protein